MTGAARRSGLETTLVLGASGLALCAWCGWVSGFHRSTTPARVTWVVSLAAVVMVDLLLRQGGRGRRPGWRLRPRSGSPPTLPGGPRRSLVATGPWLALALAVVAWEALGIDTGPREPHLTISSLTADYRAMNAAALLVWMLAGVLFGVVRARAGASGGAVSGRAAGAVALGSFRAGPPGLLLPASRGAGVAFWVCVVAAGGVVELLARRSGGRLATAAELVRLLTAPVAVRLVVVAAWAYAGYHLFAH